MSNGAGSKVGLEVMPIASVTMSDEHGPGENARSAADLARRLCFGCLCPERAERAVLLHRWGTRV
jgi:hypothetical protein